MSAFPQLSLSEILAVLKHPHAIPTSYSASTQLIELNIIDTPVIAMLAKGLFEAFTVIPDLSHAQIIDRAEQS
jgi:hypothetical protein